MRSLSRLVMTALAMFAAIPAMAENFPSLSRSVNGCTGFALEKLSAKVLQTSRGVFYNLVEFKAMGVSPVRPQDARYVARFQSNNAANPQTEFVTWQADINCAAAGGNDHVDEIISIGSP